MKPIYILLIGLLLSYKPDTFGQTRVSGNFSINVLSERFGAMNQRIPELICSGIFNKTDFTFCSLDALGLGDDFQKQMSVQSVRHNSNNILENNLRDSLNKEKIGYFISGNYTESENLFKVSFDLIDIQGKKTIRRYNSGYKPLNDIYKEIDSAAGFLKQAINLNNAGISSTLLKNVAILYFDNRLDDETISSYDMSKDFAASYAALNLRGRNKFNVLFGRDVNSMAARQITLNSLFDTLHANIIITGIISKENKKSKRIVLKPIVYTKTSFIDTLYLPEQKRSLYYKNDLLNLTTKDIQSFLDVIIDDGGNWNASVMHFSGVNTIVLFNAGNEAIAKNNLSLGTVLAYKITQKKDSVWLGFNQLGNIELKRGNNDDAISYFDEAIISNKKNIAGYEGKGNGFLNKGLYTDAIEQFNLCLKLDNNYPGIHFQLARCYFQLQNDSIFDQAKLAIESGMNIAETYNLLGKYYLEIKNGDENKIESNYDSAITHFEKAIAVNPEADKSNLSSALIQKGFFLLGKKAYVKAISCFLNSFRIDSTAESLDGARYGYTYLNKYDSVDFFMQLGLGMNLYDPANLYSAQATACISRLDSLNDAEIKNLTLQKSIHYLDLWHTVNSKDFYGLNRSKARAYFHGERYDSAIVYYKKILNKDSTLWVNYLNLAEACIMNNSASTANNILSTDPSKFRLTPTQALVTNFLKIVSKMYMDKNYDKELKDQNELIKKEFSSDKINISDWSFYAFQKWLDSGVIDTDLKNKIYEQLKLINAHTTTDIRL